MKLLKTKALLMVSIVAILLPMIALFPLHSFINGDYLDVHWMARYFIEFFKVHLAFPEVYNTQPVVGLIWPVFYGYLYFPMVALMGSIIGTDFALKLIFVLLWIGKFALSFFLIKKISQNQLLAFVVACLVIWTIYPLTNLVGRGAVGEIVATDFIFCGICTLFFLLLETKNPRRVLWCLLLGLFFALGFGSHAISLFFGGWFTIILGVFALPVIFKMDKDSKKKTFILIGYATLFCIIALSPWIYANLKFSKSMLLTKLDYNMYWRRSIDSFLGRFSPLPINWSWFFKDLDSAETYIDAEANSPLLFIVISGVATLFKSRKRKSNPYIFIFLGGVLLTFLATAISMTFSHTGAIANFAKFCQFHFRLVSYINFGIFVSLVGLLLAHPKWRPSKVILSTCFALSLVGCLMKVHQGYDPHVLEGQGTPISFKKDKNLVLDLPFNSYGYFRYSDPRIPFLNNNDYKIAVNLNIPVLRGDEFGQTGKVGFHVDGFGSQLFFTNIYRFPWISVIVDDRPVDLMKLRAGAFTYGFVNDIPGNHTLTSKFTPPLAWEVLRWLSFIALGLWTTLTFWVVFKDRKWCK